MNHGDALHRRIADLDALPSSFSVAVRLIELSLRPEAELDEYAALVRVDAALTTRLVGVANSPWCAVPRRVTRLEQAIQLLGISNVRMLAVSFCVAGIHRAWNLGIETAQSFWQAALCKAAAAKVLAPGAAEDAYTLALLQDIALGLLVDVGQRVPVQKLLAPAFDVPTQLAWERETFGLDHAACGALVARKLGLPEPYPTVIAAHHQAHTAPLDLGEPAGAHPAADPAATLNAALDAAAILPHDLRCWKPTDIARLAECLEHPALRAPAAAADAPGALPRLLDRIRREHKALVSALGCRPIDWPPILHLVRSAGVPAADSASAPAPA